MSSIEEQPLGVVPSSFTTLSMDLPSPPVLRTPVLLGDLSISDPVAVLAAASQRTSRIDLGTAVIPVGWENPLRLAEDLATVDVLSSGRLNPGVRVGPPMHYEQVKHALYPDTADAEDFGYDRVARLLDFVRGEAATDFSGIEGFEVFSDTSSGLSGVRAILSPWWRYRSWTTRWASISPRPRERPASKTTRTA